MSDSSTQATEHRPATHRQQVLVISTSEQAQAMLEHLDTCKQSARVDNYASERRRPIKWMECTCCGESYQGRQWFNQEPGYGLGDCCLDLHNADPTPGAESECYGVAGIHFLIDQAEKENPPLIEDRGTPLYGMDERLRIEYDGYVYWRGRNIEHYSHSALDNTEENRGGARELIRRCETLEGQGKPVNTMAVVWRWEE